MRSKRNKKIMILVILLLVLSLSIGYAYLMQILKINNTANIAKTTWDVHFETIAVREGSVEGTPIIDDSKTTVSLSVDFAEPGDFFEYTVDVVNGGTIDAMISILPNHLTEEQEMYLEYLVTYEDGTVIRQYDQLLALEKETIKVRISLKDADILEDLNFTIETSINYAQKDENAKEREKSSPLYNVLSDHAIDDTDINFEEMSSDTNGKGIYHLTKIETSTPIYYYRGEVNNNALFGGFCWKIIRTTDTGGVKLIYNGEPNNGVCDATGDATTIGESAFNTPDTDPKYAGYMYDNNTEDSTIKGVIDPWFENNLLDYLDYLEDTPFYNERDYNTTSMSFVANQRLGTNLTIKLGAAQKEDIFTVNKSNGNGALTYPVGLITSDEVVMAGGVRFAKSTEPTSYLCTGSYYHTLTPVIVEFYSSSVFFAIVDPRGNLYVANPRRGGVRPVISLKADTNYIRGNGTEESPFVITE